MSPTMRTTRSTAPAPIVETTARWPWITHALASEQRFVGIRMGAVVIAASALLALSAHIIVPLPFTPIPISMAPFTVLLLGLVMDVRLVTATMVAYLAEGAAGLPVFAPQGVGGLLHLFGPTGGYLLAYPLAAALIAVIYRNTRRGYRAAVLSAVCGNVVLIASGALWLALVTHLSMHTVLAMAVVPFLLGDALKILTAAGLAVGWQRLRLDPATRSRK